MSARLTESPLAAARAPLDGLRLRGWAHAGVRWLDGLLMDRATASADWRGAIRPWLDTATDVRCRGDLVLVLFAEPQTLDCAALGPFIGVMRHGPSLAAAPFEEPEPALVAHLRDHLVHVRAGVLQAVPLGAFSAEDVADWWAPDTVEVLAGRAVPGVSRPKAPRAVSAPGVAPDPRADAVFAAIREGIATSRRRGFRAFADDAAVRLARVMGRVGSALLALALVAGIVATVILLVAGFASGFWSFAQPSSIPDASGAAIPPWIFVPILVGLIAFASNSAGSAAPAEGAGGGFLRRAWHRLVQGLGWRTPGPAGPAGLVGISGAAAGLLRRPLWQRMGAWLAWHSPVGANIRRRYAERVADIERLFAASRLDEALRKALKIGADSPSVGGVFGDLPLTGPGLRERIALDLSGGRVAPISALAGDERARLEALYRLHAHRLAKAGDVERGAFILAELLSAPAEAARLLADHGRFETAARLGEARRLAPAFVIPLWFKAGNADRALALAARHDLFAELWKEVRDGDPFRERLAEAWCERLADAGAYERAAAISRGVAPLAARRRDWILRAVESGERARPNALARALVALDWRHEPADRLFARFADLLAEPDAAGASRRLALAGHLADSGFEPRRAAGAAARLRLVTHELTRRLAVDEGVHGHLPNRAAAMAALAEAGGHFALRHDLRQLRKVPKPKEAEPDRRLVIEAGPTLAAIADAVILPDHQVLIGYRSGLLRLVSGDGRELWRGQVNGFIGFVPVGEDGRVLVLRQGYDELTTMVFATDVRQLTPRGALPIVGWHGQATETGWPVLGQDGAFAMLDTAGLLRAPSDAAMLSHHWSIVMSEPGRPLAILRDKREAVLVWARLDGLVEWWSVDLTTLKVACRFWTWPPEAAPQPPAGAAKEVWENKGQQLTGLSLGRTYAAVVGAAALNRPVVREEDRGAPFLTHGDHAFTPADRAGELVLLAALETQPRHFAPMIALRGPSHWAASCDDEAAIWCGRASDMDPTWSVAFHGATALAARFTADGLAVVIHDDRGRLIALDVQNGSIMLREV